MTISQMVQELSWWQINKHPQTDTPENNSPRSARCTGGKNKGDVRNKKILKCAKIIETNRGDLKCD